MWAKMNFLSPIEFSHCPQLLTTVTRNLVLTEISVKIGFGFTQLLAIVLISEKQKWQLSVNLWDCVFTTNSWHGAIKIDSTEANLLLLLFYHMLFRVATHWWQANFFSVQIRKKMNISNQGMKLNNSCPEGNILLEVRMMTSLASLKCSHLANFYLRAIKIIHFYVKNTIFSKFSYN